MGRRLLLENLAGIGANLKNCEINLGSSRYEEYIIILPDDYDSTSTLIINAENCQFSFASSTTKHISNLHIISYIGGVKFAGGVFVENLSYVERNVILSCRASDLENITKISCDYDGSISKLQTKSGAISFGHGTGADVFGSETSFKSLREMKEDLPEIKWVNFIVTWAATSLNIADCQINPSIEKSDDALPWIKSSITPKLVSHPSGVVNFGRTYFDEELILTIQKAKELGLKVCITPSLLIDTPGKPWRGEITGDSSLISKFYSTAYKPFILHYINLLVGKIDAFVIGSELKGLTKICSADDSSVFPFVDYLIELSQIAKEKLSTKCIITYAACWDEYHHSDGGKRPIDKLWASATIDVVGINAYFPASDTTISKITEDGLREGLLSGKDYNFWIDGEGRKHDLSPEWAVKNLRHWYENYHYSSGIKTSWTPAMKKIWFTECGFASLDKSSNEPGKFFDGSSSSLPSSSTGHIAVPQIIRGLLAIMSEYSDLVEEFFIYQWDARGRDWHKNPEWADANSWWYSHGLEGKIPPTEHDLITEITGAAGSADESIVN